MRPKNKKVHVFKNTTPHQVPARLGKRWIQNARESLAKGQSPRKPSGIEIEP